MITSYYNLLYFCQKPFTNTYNFEKYFCNARNWKRSSLMGIDLSHFVPKDAVGIFQFSCMKQRSEFFPLLVTYPSHLKCSFSETNYLKYARGPKKGLLYARLESEVRAMNSLNRMPTLWILNSIWLVLSMRGEYESAMRSWLACRTWLISTSLALSVWKLHYSEIRGLNLAKIEFIELVNEQKIHILKIM